MTEDNQALYNCKSCRDIVEQTLCRKGKKVFYTCAKGHKNSPAAPRSVTNELNSFAMRAQVDRKLLAA